MVRIAVAVIVVASACACGSRGVDDKDPIKDKLFAAKQAYDKDIQQFRRAVGDWFDKREEVARRDGNKKLVDQIKDERKAFDESGELPKTATAALKQKPALARKALEAAYGQAVKDYVKAKKDDQAAAVEGELQALTLGGTTDLIALTDTKTRAVSGEWKKDGNKLLVAAGSAFARFELPYEPSEEYDVEVSFRRVAGNDAFGVGLVAGGNRVLAIFDGWAGSGHRSGLASIDDKSPEDNITTIKGPLLKANTDHTLFLSVRAGKIDVSLNGKGVVAFKGEFSRFSLPDEWGVPNKKALYLFTAANMSFQINRITVTPVKGKGTVLK